MTKKHWSTYPHLASGHTSTWCLHTPAFSHAHPDSRPEVHKSQVPDHMDKCVLYGGVWHFQRYYCSNSLTSKNVISSHALHRNHHIRVRFKHHSSRKYGMFIKSSFWHPEFGKYYWIFGKFLGPCIRVECQGHMYKGIPPSLCSSALRAEHQNRTDFLLGLQNNECKCNKCMLP